MREVVTTLLDMLGLLAIAAGVGAGLSQWLGWWALGVAGVLVIAGSQVAAALNVRGGPR